MAFTSSIFACRSVSVGGTSVAGATHADIQVSGTEITDPGSAGSIGPAEIALTNLDIQVTIYARDDAELLTLVGASAANVVIGYKGTGGANRTKTIKSVAFTTMPSAVQIPAKDSGGMVPRHAIRGRAQWGSSDTLALMIVDAAAT